MAKPTLSTDHAVRKATPIVTGVLDYFPLAIAEVARVSVMGNRQHNLGEPLHWARDKSLDHADCIGRHLAGRGTLDTDGQRHSAKLAWRALALLQTELELEQGYDAAAIARAERAGKPDDRHFTSPPKIGPREDVAALAEKAARREKISEFEKKIGDLLIEGGREKPGVPITNFGDRKGFLGMTATEQAVAELVF